MHKCIFEMCAHVASQLQQLCELIVSSAIEAQSTHEMSK